MKRLFANIEVSQMLIILFSCTILILTSSCAKFNNAPFQPCFHEDIRPLVTVVGDVEEGAVAWNAGLTLDKTISIVGETKSIIQVRLFRKGSVIDCDLSNAKNILLEINDVVRIYKSDLSVSK